jgi:VIT1/CCC1 family predicted Fe2+/Mn2+ transporter
MRQLIDFRFGHGTWKSIVEERAKRIQEEKDRIEAERKIRIRKQQETEELVKKVLVVAGGLASVVGVILAVLGYI